jgi:hypothetical protein
MLAQDQMNKQLLQDSTSLETSARPPRERKLISFNQRQGLSSQPLLHVPEA